MNNQPDLISVIVPIYKVEKYLSRCLDSILSQTYKNFELILINDGSPDNCSVICDTYAGKHDNIIVIHKENGGLSSARNAGIDIAKGKYISFIDSDDYIHKDYLNILVSMLNNSEAKLSMCGYKEVFDLTKIEVGIGEISFKVITDESAMELILYEQSKCTAWAKLFDIDLFRDIRFPEGKIMEDMFVMPILFKKAQLITISSQELYYYNQEGESITRSSFNYKKLDMVEAALVWKNHVEINYPILFEKASIHYYTIMINYCIYLYKINDLYGKDIFKQYKKIIFENFKFIFNSKYTSRNTKIKLILIKLRLISVFIKLKK
jgi:glycosyltransferase involved in cell wall biosynthesis